MPNIAHDAIRTSTARPPRLYSSNVLEVDFSDVRSCNTKTHPDVLGPTTVGGPRYRELRRIDLPRDWKAPEGCRRTL
jgi:hypothetical protein